MSDTNALSAMEQQIADALADTRHFAIRSEPTDEGRLVVRRTMQAAAEHLAREVNVTDREAFQAAAQAPRCYECGSRHLSRYDDGSIASGLCGACERDNDL